MTAPTRPEAVDLVVDFSRSTPATAVAPSTYEDCDRCSFLYYASPEAEAPQFVYGRGWPGQMLKPVGKPCPRCGDVSPRGTWPWNGPVWFRLKAEGEGPGTVFHGKYGYPGVRVTTPTLEAA